MSAPAATTPGADAAAASWRLALPLLGGLFVLWLLVFHQSLWAMVDVWWRSETFGHGFLIAPIAAYLVWQRRSALARQWPVPAPWALAVVAGSVLLWFVARVAGVLAVEEFAAVFVLQSAVLALLGWRVFLTLIFPLGYLLLMVPFGEFLVNPLQDVTVFFVVNALRLIGIPVYSDGIFLQIPNGNFTVAEACAGLRFLVATLALGLLFANAAYQDWWRRAVFMVLVFIVPVVANGFRALGIVLLAHYTDNQVAIAADHVIYGWVFLTFVTLCLLVLGMALRARTARPDPGPVLPARAPRPAGLVACGAGLAALLAAAPVLSAVLHPAADPPGTLRVALPEATAPWSRIDGAGDWVPTFQGATDEAVARFANGDTVVDLYVAYYAHQAQDAEVVNPNNRIAPEPDWQRAADQSVMVTVDGRPISVIATRIIDAERRRPSRLVLRWYWVGGRMTGSQIEAKLLQLWGLMTGQPAAAAVAVATDDPGGEAVALGRLREFLASLPRFDATLEQVAGP